MAIVCTCPRGPEIPDIPASDCPVSFGQLQKIIIMRVFNDDGTKNVFPMPESDPRVKATWTPLLVAADSTKVVVSPFLSAPTDEPGALREFGGGNETPGGVAYVIGREPTGFTGRIDRVDQAVIKAMKEYGCENIAIVPIDENGSMEMLVEGQGTTAKYYPIPIQKFFVGDKAHGGLEGVDNNAISWNYPPNWSDNLTIITPTDFNPLTDLKKPVTP